MLPALLARLRSQPSRTGSLIVTLFGDAIAPRGGELALASLTDILRLLDIGDGVVRTAVSRLAAEGWLERRRAGRHSFYRPSPAAAAETEAAARRIYAAPTPAWDGQLRLLLDPGPDRPALLAAGWAALTPTLLISPAAPGETLRATGAPATLRALAARAWPLPDLAARYHAFLETFPDTAVPDREALPVRLLLIHEFRRLALRDPGLPPALLPPDWPGAQARARAAALYRRLHPASEAWLDAHAQGAEGPLPPATRGRAFA